MHCLGRRLYRLEMDPRMSTPLPTQMHGTAALRTKILFALEAVVQCWDFCTIVA